MLIDSKPFKRAQGAVTHTSRILPASGQSLETEKEKAIATRFALAELRDFRSPAAQVLIWAFMLGCVMLSRPDLWIRFESLVVFFAAVAWYAETKPASWIVFAIAFLLPDLSLLAYAGGQNRKSASGLYNLAHNYAFPVLLLAFGFLGRHPLCAAVAAAWISHIALDRLLGFGLKFTQAFKPTHVQSAGIFAGRKPGR